MFYKAILCDKVQLSMDLPGATQTSFFQFEIFEICSSLNAGNLSGQRHQKVGKAAKITNMTIFDKSGRCSEDQTLLAVAS